MLSLYLSPDPTRPSAPAACEGELDALLADLAPQASESDGERTREMLRTMIPALPYGTRSLALFSSAEGGASAAVPLPEPVQAMAVLEAVPWVEPLAGMFTPGDWGAAILGRRSTRLLRGGPRTLVEFATVRHEIDRGHGPRGLSQVGVRHAMRRGVGEHVRHLSGLLMRAHRRRPFTRLVVSAPRELQLLVEDALHSELRDRLAGLVALDLQDAPAREIGRAVAPVLEASRQTNGFRMNAARRRCGLLSLIRPGSL